MVYETRNPTQTNRHANHLRISRFDDQFLGGKNGLHFTHFKLQRNVNSVMLRYEKNTSKGLTDRIIQHTTKSFANTPSKRVTKRIFSYMHGAVKYTFKQAANRTAGDRASSSILDMFTKSQEFAQSTVCCLMQTPILTTPIIKLVN